MNEVIPKLTKTEVTCLKYYNQCILAGIGNELHIYSDTGILLFVYQVFKNTRIHGIFPNNKGQIAVLGACNLAVYECDVTCLSLTKMVYEKEWNDWLLYAGWINSDNNLALIFGKNYVKLLDSKFKVVGVFQCFENCTILSAILINNLWKQAYVVAGTALAKIYLWKPNAPVISVLMELGGHNGLVYSLSYSDELNLIASVADDRTVCLWQMLNKKSGEQFDHNKSDIVLKHRMYGHEARIFRCVFASNFVVTASDDSFIHIWDTDGQLFRKFETHQGAPVWALDYSEYRETIFSGGTDCGISVHPLAMKHTLSKFQQVEDLPRCLAITATNNVVVITVQGQLMYYRINEQKWLLMNNHDDLKDYAVLGTSESRDLFALAGIRGTIHIYKEVSNCVVKQFSTQADYPTRIYSVYFLKDEEILTCSAKELHLWLLKSNDSNITLELVKKFKLPTIKQPWVIAAVKCFGDKIAVSDRKGNIYLYSLDNDKFTNAFKGAHCYLGVHKLLFMEDCIISCGRDGYLNHFKLEENQLQRAKSDKLPFSWVCDLIKRNDTLILLGFSGRNFIIFDYSNRMILKEVNCGGGHRSWSFAANDTSLNLVFIRDKVIYHFSTNWSAILANNILAGFHSNIINVLKTITCPIQSNKVLFVTGGEDTTCRISLADLSADYINFINIDILKMHWSSIRSIAACAVNADTFFIFCGGGRCQLTLHKLELSSKDGEISKINCSYLDTYYKSLDEEDAETRFMDLIYINNLLLIAGCSNGELQCFMVTPTQKLKHLSSYFNSSHCIFKLSYVCIQDKIIVLAASSDGCLSFWDFTEVLRIIHLFYFKSGNDETYIQLKPMLTLQVHQCGINALCTSVYNDSNFLVATGGDDNKVVLLAMGTDGTNFTVERWHDMPKEHFTRVTGIQVQNDFVFAVSDDQNISVHKVSFSQNQPTLVNSHKFTCAIPDIQGMEMVQCHGKLCLCVHGNGLQVLEIPNSA